MKDGTLKQAGKILSLFEDTPSEQVQALLASGLLADLRDANVAAINRDNFRKFVGLTPKNLSLLEFLGTIAVPAVKKFSVQRNFVVDTGDDALVKISCIGDNFKEWFGSKIKTNVPAEQFRYAKLLKSSLDGPILKEFGNNAEAKLAYVFSLMELQPNGEEGALLRDGRANIFYVHDDINNLLRAVGVVWGGGGWVVGASSVSCPFVWGVGRRVFSRNSSVPVAV